MTFAFLNPLFLYGLAAAGAPVLIHLINRRRAKPLRFPAVRFVLRANQRIARRYKLRQLLLLALRTLAILVFASVLARPVLTEEGTLLTGGGPPVALVVIFDTSMSLGYSGATGLRMDSARALLDSYLEQLRSEDSVALLATNADQPAAPQLSSEVSRVRGAAARLQPTFGRADFRAAIANAYQLLSTSAATRKQILILTDRQEAGWSSFDAGAIDKVDPDVLMQVVRIGGARPDENRTVERLALKGNIIGSDVPTVLEASVENFSPTPAKRVLAQLIVDGVKVDQQLLDLGPGEHGVARFEVAFDKPGRHAGVVQIGADRLRADDQFFFSLEVNDRIDVLVVDGDPRTSLVYSETFFLVNALNPGSTIAPSLIRPRVITAAELVTADLARAQTVILANVATLDDQTRQRLFNYVRDGGSLIFFLGTQTEPGAYNDQFHASTTRLLPAPLVAHKQAPAGQPWHLESIDAQHPALRMFRPPVSEALHQTKVFGYIETSEQFLSGGGKALLGLSDGAPLLIEGRVGSGKVLLFTSTADRDWNDFNTKTSYLPLMQNLVLYLSGARANRLEEGLEVGEAKTITAEAGAAGSEVTVTNPRGLPKVLRLQPQGVRAQATFTGNTIPGIYTISGGDIQQAYHVNVPLDESKLEEFPAERLREKFQHLSVTITDVVEGSTATATPSARQREMWPFFFAALFGLLVVETVFAAIPVKSS